MAKYHDFRAKPVDNAFIDRTERSRQLKRQRTYWRKKMVMGEGMTREELISLILEGFKVNVSNVADKGRLAQKIHKSTDVTRKINFNRQIGLPPKSVASRAGAVWGRIGTTRTLGTTGRNVVGIAKAKGQAKAVGKQALRVVADPVVGPGRVAATLLKAHKAGAVKRDLKKVAQHIPARSQVIGQGVEATAFANKGAINPARWAVHRVTRAGAHSPRPKSKHVTQATDTKKVGNFVIEKLPYREPVYSGHRSRKMPVSTATPSGADTGQRLQLNLNKAMKKFRRAGEEPQITQLIRHPKGGHVQTDLIWKMAKNDGRVAMDAHLSNIGIHPKTRKAEIIDPGFMPKIPKERKQAVRDFMMKTDPTSMSSHDYRVALAKAAGHDRQSAVNQHVSSHQIQKFMRIKPPDRNASVAGSSEIGHRSQVVISGSGNPNSGTRILSRSRRGSTGKGKHPRPGSIRRKLKRWKAGPRGGVTEETSSSQRARVRATAAGRRNDQQAGQVWFIPKNKQEMTKLAKRSKLKHLGHGLLRYVGGNAGVAAMSTGMYLDPTREGEIGHGIVKVAGGLSNVARYGLKVRHAKMGLHRRQTLKQQQQIRRQAKKRKQLGEGYAQTVGRGNRYAGRDRLSSNTAGDSPPSATSPTSRTPANRPQQQGRVVRKPINVSEVYSLDHGINESALAKAGGKMNAAAADGTINGVNPASSTPVISNNSMSQVAVGGGRAAGTLGGGFGTSGKGSSRFMGSGGGSTTGRVSNNTPTVVAPPKGGSRQLGGSSPLGTRTADRRSMPSKGMNLGQVGGNRPSSRSGAQRFRFNPATSRPSFGRNQSMMRSGGGGNSWRQRGERMGAASPGGAGYHASGGRGYGGGGGYGAGSRGSVTTSGYSQRRSWGGGGNIGYSSKGGWSGGVSGGYGGSSSRWGGSTSYR